MGTTKSREFKINWLSSKINMADVQGVSLDKDKLLNEFCLATFSTIRTAEEILKILINSGRVYLKDNDVLGQRMHDEFLRLNAGKEADKILNEEMSELQS